MTAFEARAIASALKHVLLPSVGKRMKAIHVIPRLHEGVLTIRVFSVPHTAEEPASYMYNAEEIE